MPTMKMSTHLTNDKGAIICQNKTGAHKAPFEAWEKLPAHEQCGNCRRVLARKTGKERVNFGSVSIRRSRDANGQNLVTGDARASYTPRYGQV